MECNRKLNVGLPNLEAAVIIPFWLKEQNMWKGEELQQGRPNALQNPNPTTWEVKIQVQILAAREKPSA